MVVVCFWLVLSTISIIVNVVEVVGSFIDISISIVVVVIVFIVVVIFVVVVFFFVIVVVIIFNFIFVVVVVVVVVVGVDNRRIIFSLQRQDAATVQGHE